MKNKKSLLIIFIILVISNNLSAINLSENPENIYYNLQDSFLNNDVKQNVILIQLNELEKNILKNTTSGQEQYLLARINLLKGFILKNLSDKTGSIMALETSQQFAEEALKQKNDADYWRIKAEAGSLIMIQLGLPYIIANAGTIQDYTDKAIEINSGNIRAQVLDATGLISRPFIFGGNVKKGVEILEAIKNPGASDPDRFFVLYNLSIGYQKLGKLEDAEKACRDALRLYPGNISTLELLSQLTD